jgi:carbonic anhydrase/acetyltransferase-like protein (isoleucine patch superfamily)
LQLRIYIGEATMIYSLGDRKVEVLGEQFIAPSASVIGSVILEDNVSVWFNVVIRADNDVIHIGEGSNIQDGSVLHVDPGFPLTIGKRVTVGHKVMLHGCTVGDGSLIGMNAVVLNGARIGKGCLIGANALVTENMEVPDGSVVLGSPGKIRRTLNPETQEELAAGAQRYIDRGKRYREQLVETTGLS